MNVSQNAIPVPDSGTRLYRMAGQSCTGFRDSGADCTVRRDSLKLNRRFTVPSGGTLLRLYQGGLWQWLRKATL